MHAARNPGSAPVVVLGNVSVSYSSGMASTPVLADVSLSIQHGEYLAIAGPSGCGKSTLLAMIGLLEKPDRGEVFIDGLATGALRERDRAHLRNRAIGFVFQSFELVPELTVADNVALPLVYASVAAGVRQKRAQALLERVGLATHASRYPFELSGGQQQRVAIARALITEPAILLADEPTGNLDSEAGAQIRALLAELHATGATLVVATHDPAFAGDAVRRVSMLNGRIVCDQLGTEIMVARPVAGTRQP